MISVITKKCSKCTIEKDVSEFGKRIDRPDGLQYFCKPCARSAVNQIRLADPEGARIADAKYKSENKLAFAASQKRYRETHRSLQRERTNLWRAKNPHLVREQKYKRRLVEGVDKKYVSAKEIRTLLSKPCFYCGVPSSQIDHVVPFAKGGRHSIGNLVPACGACNRSKGASFIVEWKRRLAL